MVVVVIGRFHEKAAFECHNNDVSAAIGDGVFVDSDVSAHADGVDLAVHCGSGMKTARIFTGRTIRAVGPAIVFEWTLGISRNRADLVEAYARRDIVRALRDDDRVRFVCMSGTVCGNDGRERVRIDNERQKWIRLVGSRLGGETLVRAQRARRTPSGCISVGRVSSGADVVVARSEALDAMPPALLTPAPIAILYCGNVPPASVPPEVTIEAAAVVPGCCDATSPEAVIGALLRL